MENRAAGPTVSGAVDCVCVVPTSPSTYCMQTMAGEWLQFHSAQSHQARNLGECERVVLLIDLEPRSNTSVEGAPESNDATGSHSTGDNEEPMPRWLADQIESQARCSVEVSPGGVANRSRPAWSPQPMRAADSSLHVAAATPPHPAHAHAGLHIVSRPSPTAHLVVGCAAPRASP